MPAHRRLDRSKARRSRRSHAASEGRQGSEGPQRDRSPRQPHSRGQAHEAAHSDAPARSARDAAYRVIAAHAERYPDLLPMGSRLDELARNLDPRDAALAHAIADAAVRRWGTLSYIGGLFSRQPFERLEPGVRAAILGGAAQLLLLDRVPPHAALNESVEWAKHNMSRGASSVVNAVLRRVASLRAPGLRDSWDDARDALPRGDGRAVPLTDFILPEDPARRLCVATSTPRSLLDARIATHGQDAARDLCLHDIASPPTIINARHAADTERLAASTDPHDDPGMLVWNAGPEALGSMLRARGDVWVQDPTAANALADANDAIPAGLTVRTAVDLCAGRGTKTRQLLAMRPDARVIAADTDPDRLADLRRLAQSEFACTPAGDSRLTVMTADEAADSVGGEIPAADLVLLDVPCSNSGVLPRRPEARYRIGVQQARRLAEIQCQILARGVKMLAPGGVLIYSTCSLDQIENGEVAAWARRTTGLNLLAERTAAPAGLPGDPPTAYRDGGYVAVLTR